MFIVTDLVTLKEDLNLLLIALRIPSSYHFRSFIDHQSRIKVDAVTCSSFRRASIFSNISSKTTRPIERKFLIETPYNRATKFDQMVLIIDTCSRWPPHTYILKQNFKYLFSRTSLFVRFVVKCPSQQLWSYQTVS